MTVWTEFLSRTRRENEASLSRVTEHPWITEMFANIYLVHLKGCFILCDCAILIFPSSLVSTSTTTTINNSSITTNNNNNTTNTGSEYVVMMSYVMVLKKMG